MQTIRHEQKTFLVYLLTVISNSSGYQIFQTKIPNGDRVTNPCDHTVWQGVSHLNKQGGGDRNPFGKVFVGIIIVSEEKVSVYVKLSAKPTFDSIGSINNQVCLKHFFCLSSHKADCDEEITVLIHVII